MEAKFRFRIRDNAPMGRMTHRIDRRTLGISAIALITARLTPWGARPAAPSEIVIDWAIYNPVGLVLKDQRLLETAFAPDNISIRWVQSAGSNKALEFLNAGSLDFGSTAGAAALIGKVNGNPLRTIYVFSRPEWTALVTKPDSPINTVADLKGQRVAVTRGTDPHIFLVRALATAGLSEKDVKLVLDPMMAAAELESHARLFYRNPAANTWGVLNVREAFATAHPDIVRKVLTQYEVAGKWAIAHKPELITMMGEADKLSAAVNERQLERTDLSSGMIGETQAATIIEAGKALQTAGVLDPALDVTAITHGMIDASYARAIGA